MAWRIVELRRTAGCVLAAGLLATGLAAAQAQDAPPPLVANGPRAEAGLLHIGETGIRCLRLPCPGRGLFVPGPWGQADRQNLLYADRDGRTPPPPMIGAAADRAAIAEAWDERRCLALVGRLIPGADDRPVLRVDRIVGACGRP